MDQIPKGWQVGPTSFLHPAFFPPDYSALCPPDFAIRASRARLGSTSRFRNPSVPGWPRPLDPRPRIPERRGGLDLR